MMGYELWHPFPPSERDVIEGADCLLSTTVDETRRHNPWLPPARVLHLGVDLSQRAESALHAKPLLVLVSRVDTCDRFKGHDLILDAWPAVLTAVPDARFVAIGGGSDLEMLRGRVRSERLDGVEFTGFVSPDERDYTQDHFKARVLATLGPVVEADWKGVADEPRAQR
jgi:phosphatidylinositol alpha-1,6-mannosyltransferase